VDKDFSIILLLYIIGLLHTGIHDDAVRFRIHKIFRVFRTVHLLFAHEICSIEDTLSVFGR